MGLRRLEFIAEMMMFRVVPPAEVNAILAGERDAEVLAWGR